MFLQSFLRRPVTMKKKILLVDDIKEFRSLLKLLLSGDFDVVTAEDGEKALDMIESGCNPDVIVTDLLMPRMDGYQLIDNIRNREPWKKIPIIVLSNVDKADDRQRLAYNKGINTFLNKPFNTRELNEGLKKSLDQVLENVN